MYWSSIISNFKSSLKLKISTLFIRITRGFGVLGFWGFGDRNGVVNNAEMLIKRGSQLIGKVRITSVEPSTSIADIVVNSLRSGLSVQPGDTVIYAGPGEEATENKGQP